MNTTTVIVVVAVCAIVGIFIWCIFRYLKAKKAQALHDIYSTGNGEHERTRFLRHLTFSRMVEFRVPMSEHGLAMLVSCV